ncbi:alpha-D-ribose 1-methylphosphonate 5-triphosphate synthase subunit PhnL [Desulfosarcina sp. BuS5]|uniref:phosphonate C-P lyase system protein PhnL n=1 Tax=Desulfosarcina sp. BuS5 TaxID=933262 RepID=UPI000481D335|nr:phosphonate C-P lyase system protein PhnL [Desulfosarcina sp. BuS5]WDN89846.1 alpha-D-ribose 1-methylphosphonate 5-triphosphate synthase subunit PhnL [Desulfosarcina sp. BuS5]
MNQNKILNVLNLSKIFNIHILEEKTIQGCSKITFDLEEGESLGLSGPSGSGKSSILKCIYQTYIPTKGTIWYKSKKYGKVDLTVLAHHQILSLRRNEIGYVSQFLNIIPRIRAVDIVASNLLQNGVSQKDARKRAAEILEMLKIPSHLFDAYPCTFSGGEQQRVNIAMGVIKKPRLLLLDEPTASLDEVSIAAVIEVLEELKKEGTAIIGIFHDTKIMNLITDKVYNVTAEAGL